MNTGAFSLLRLAILLCTLIAVRAHGQEEVIQFCNSCLPSPPDRLVRDVNGNPLAGTNYLVQLYHGSTPDTLVAFPGAPGRFRPTTTVLPGTWINGGYRSIFPPIPATIILQVRVWDINAGMTYEEASQNTTGRQYGESAAFIYEPCGSPPRSADCQFMLGFRGFTLVTNAPPAPAGVLAIQEHSGGGVEILYQGTHTVERAASLRGPWVVLATQSGPLIDQAAASEAVRFYRINDHGTYSPNAVGFYRVSLCNGYSLIANQLNPADGNRISNLFPSPPDGTRILKFNPATGGFMMLQFIDGEWEGGDVEMMLNPGEGAYLQTTLTSHRFLGEVSMLASVPIPSGFSLISNPLPEAGPVNLVPPNGMGLPVRNGTRVYQWNCASQGFIVSQFLDGIWDPEGSPAGPIVGIGEAFYFYNPGQPLMWNRTFSVGP